MLTRAQAVDFLQGRGFPVTLYAMNHYARSDDGPVPCARWGKRFLYEPRELLTWAARKMKVLPQRFPGASPPVHVDEKSLKQQNNSN